MKTEAEIRAEIECLGEFNRIIAENIHNANEVYIINERRNDKIKTLIWVLGGES